MKTCSQCGGKTNVLAHNVRTGESFCLDCAPASYFAWVLTVEDVRFLRSVGVNPDLGPELEKLVQAAQKVPRGAA